MWLSVPFVGKLSNGDMYYILKRNGVEVKRTRGFKEIADFLELDVTTIRRRYFEGKKILLDDALYEISDTKDRSNQTLDELKRVLKYLTNPSWKYKTISNLNEKLLNEYLLAHGVKAKITHFKELKCYVVERI